MFYKGKGEHSVIQLEKMVEQLLEKEHRLNAPYPEECLTRLKRVLNNKKERLPECSQDYSDIEYVIDYFKAILKQESMG